MHVHNVDRNISVNELRKSAKQEDNVFVKVQTVSYNIIQNCYTPKNSCLILSITILKNLFKKGCKKFLQFKFNSNCRLG